MFPQDWDQLPSWRGERTLPHQLQIEKLPGRILIGQAWVGCPPLDQSLQPEKWDSGVGQACIIRLRLWSEVMTVLRVGTGLWRPNPQTPVAGTCPHPSRRRQLCPALLLMPIPLLPQPRASLRGSSVPLAPVYQGHDTPGAKNKSGDYAHHFSGSKELNMAARSSGLGAGTRDGWNWKETEMLHFMCSGRFLAHRNSGIHSHCYCKRRKILTEHLLPTPTYPP